MNILEKEKQCKRLVHDIDLLANQISNLRDTLESKKEEYYTLKNEIKNHNLAQAHRKIIEWLGEKDEGYNCGFSTYNSYYIRAIVRKDIYVSGKNNPKGNKEQLFQILKGYNINSVFISSSEAENVYITYIKFDAE